MLAVLMQGVETMLASNNIAISCLRKKLMSRKRRCVSTSRKHQDMIQEFVPGYYTGHYFVFVSSKYIS